MAKSVSYGKSYKQAQNYIQIPPFVNVVITYEFSSV